MKENCEFCRALCSEDTESHERLCFLEFNCRHGFLFEDEDTENYAEYMALKRNLRDWKAWLRENE